MNNKKGFIFIETIIVICILTIALMSLYNNYSKIITNTRELNTFDTTEYNYKTFFLKKTYTDTDPNGFHYTSTESKKIHFSDTSLKNKCHELSTVLPWEEQPNPAVYILKRTDATKICLFEDPKNTALSEYDNLDAYIIDYMNAQDFATDNVNLFVVEYKKEDKLNEGEYLTYISSLHY